MDEVLVRVVEVLPSTAVVVTRDRLWTLPLDSDIMLDVSLYTTCSVRLKMRGASCTGNQRAVCLKFFDSVKQDVLRQGRKWRRKNLGSKTGE